MAAAPTAPPALYAVCSFMARAARRVSWSELWAGGAGWWLWRWGCGTVCLLWVMAWRDERGLCYEGRFELRSVSEGAGLRTLSGGRR